MKKLGFLLIMLLIFVSFPLLTNAEEKRISGRDRFEVAINISKQNWPQGADTVYLSNYLAFADALTATPLAYKSNSPILLSHANVLTEQTKQELLRLKPRNVVLIGGSGSLQPKIIEELKRMNIPNITRIDGRDRFEVAANVAAKLPPSTTAIVTNGFVFADALSIAPYAAINGYPILLTSKDQIPSSIGKALSNHPVTKSLIIGGEGSVANGVRDKLVNPERIGGADRYEVAANIANAYFQNPQKGYLATGFTFADALTGSVAAAKANAPVLLTKTSEISEGIQSYLIKYQLKDITILGGTGSVKSGIYYEPGNWEIKKPGSNLLQGYVDHTSYYPGDAVNFFINSSKSYNIEVYRMGYNEGKGAELKGVYGKYSAQVQKANPNPTTLAANWSKSLSFTIPNNWQSGMYMAKIINHDPKETYVPFVVKESIPTAKIGVVISTNTYQAYNNWGGKSLYGYNSSSSIPAIKISFDRPYNDGNGSGQFFSYEYNLIRWLEKKGNNLAFFTNEDIEKGALRNSSIKTLLIAGHDEYWTKKNRDEVESLTQTNMNLGIFSANVGYWQVRMEDNNRTMVAYKGRANEDPYHTIDSSMVTTLFRSSPVNRPEDRVFGIMYNGIPEKTMPLMVTNESHWLYAGTGLRNGDQIEGVVGGETDGYSGVIPNVEVIASSPIRLYGNPGHSDVVWYQKPEGGKVFAVGTFYWNWFLDSYGHESQASYHPGIEKITSNALNELMK